MKNNSNNLSSPKGKYDGPFSLYTTCYKCNKQLKVEYYDDDDFESYETVSIGRKGMCTVHYCPYCGEANRGFSPYDIHEPMKFDDSFNSDDFPEDDDSDVDSWWPDSDGADLIPDDPPEEQDDNPFKMDDDADTKTFTCRECNKTFRLNPKDCEHLFCLYCGKTV